jgi:hypothetical protein
MGVAASDRSADNKYTDLYESVKDYARQETLGPLRGAGRWIGFGIAGSLSVGIGAAFLALGLLRLLQTECAGFFHGRWMSLLPYVAALVLSLVVVGLALTRVNTTPLHKDSD